MSSSYPRGLLVGCPPAVQHQTRSGMRVLVWACAHVRAVRSSNALRMQCFGRDPRVCFWPVSLAWRLVHSTESTKCGEGIGA